MRAAQDVVRRPVESVEAAQQRVPAEAAPAPGDLRPDAPTGASPSALGEATGRFLSWWTDRSSDDSVWPAFDLFLRETLVNLAAARQVRLFHIVQDGRALRALADEVGAPTTPLSASDLMQHVVSVGRRYVRGDWSHGPLVDRLAFESGKESPAAPLTGQEPQVMTESNGAAHPATGPVAWMFTIRDHEAPAAGVAAGPANRSIGLVVVGDLPESSLTDRARLDALADLVTEFWLHVRDYECLQLVRRTDRGSGVLTRTDFLRLAEHAAAEAQREGEPIALLAVALEGLRRFDDQGLWSLRDRVILETGRALRRRLRTSDLVGRFSDDRFVILLRWLDVSLGRLIGVKVIQWVQEAAAEAARKWQEDNRGACDPIANTIAPGPAGTADSMKVRCGLACDQKVTAAQPDERFAWADVEDLGPERFLSLRELLMGALSASAEARRRGEDLCVADRSAIRQSASEATLPEPIGKART